MKKVVEIRLKPDALHDSAEHKALVAQELGLELERISSLALQRRSLDSRHRAPRFILRFEVCVDEQAEPEAPSLVHYPDVRSSKEVLVVGAGPAGLFAALRLIEHGLKPIVLERGKDVRRRRHDVASISKHGELNPESNYCFGEGGAGTFSDGKLYTRSTKRGDVLRILRIFVQHGADPQILIDAHPHIGTNKLPKIVSAMRESIVQAGGEVRFDARVTGLDFDSRGMKGVTVEGQGALASDSVVLATGHSARDVFFMLDASGVLIEAKPFALGVRVEHPQALIDEVQYGTHPRHENLPAASYALKAQKIGRGVFSFCMCPGGVICPAATSQGELVVNGWSPSKRNGRFANSGIVVQVTLDDLASRGKGTVLWQGLELQQEIERQAFVAGGGNFVAPAQRLDDFVKDKTSSSLPDCSYNPGVASSKLSEVLGAVHYAPLREAFKEFATRMPPYLSREAIVLATESRTSSPIRIPREPKTLEHPQVAGLYPCAEGAGYAGGIMSAALDGERVADAILRKGQ